MRLPIRTKILLAALATVALVAGLIAFLARAQRDLAALMDEMIQRHTVVMRLAQQIKYDYVLYDDLVFRTLFTGDRGLMSECVRVREKARGAIARLRDLPIGDTERELLDDILEESDRYDLDVKRLIDTYAFATEDQKKNVLDLIRTLESGAGPATPVRQSQKQTLALLSAEGRARLTRLYSQCEKLGDIARAKLEEAQERVRRSAGETRRDALIAGAAVVAGTAAVALLLGAGLLAPLRNLLRGVQKVTAGELDLELPVEGADEIGHLTREFNAMTRNLREKQERLTAETITDPLTELHNFRHFQARLKDEIARASRHRHPFALIILDIDHFKHYNDTHGHPMGNVLLKQLADALRETLRREDFVARYGGEEFAVILPETSAENARVAAERLRAGIEQSEFPGQERQPSGRLTVSVGGAVFPADGAVAGALIEKADKALYAAKKAGRNRVAWASGPV